MVSQPVTHCSVASAALLLTKLLKSDAQKRRGPITVVHPTHQKVNMERVLLQTLLRLDSGTFTDLSNRIDEANRRARAAAVDKKLQAAKRGAAVAGVAGAGIACMCSYST